MAAASMIALPKELYNLSAVELGDWQALRDESSKSLDSREGFGFTKSVPIAQLNSVVALLKTCVSDARVTSQMSLVISPDKQTIQVMISKINARRE